MYRSLRLFTQISRSAMSGVNSSGTSATVWLERDNLISSDTPFQYPKLKQNIETDVLVVGGGIAGLHIAYELLKAGQSKVVLVEDGKIGSGETGRTTGHLSVDNEYNEFVSLHGKDGTRNVAAAQQGAIERIASIVKEHDIDCDFARVPGYMFHGLRPSDKKYDDNLVEQLYTAASETHALDVKMVDGANIPGFDSGKTIKFENQATFHPTKYIRALAKVVTDQLGGQIYEGTRMQTYNEESSGIDVETADGKKIKAKSLVMATNVPLQKLVIIDRLEAYRTYAVAFKIRKNEVSETGEEALWWDMAEPYHYVRVTPHKETGYSLLIVGGEDEKVGQHEDGEERYQRLIKWTNERWSTVGEVEYKWSGQVMDSIDGIAYIGRNPGEKNVYIHTGDNGDGLTYAAVGGELIRDLILGRENPLAHTFSPSRQHSTSHLRQAIKVLPDYITENISDQVYFVKWITRCTKTITDIEDLVPGEGDVVRDGVHPVAVYKDEQGQTHKMTAGIVTWNSAEKSFDCPIHGSRFTCKGELVNGPAKGGLEAR